MLSIIIAMIEKFIAIVGILCNVLCIGNIAMYCYVCYVMFVYILY